MSKTVPVSGMLDTTDPSDTYPLLNDASLWGGFRVVANSAVREAIPIDRRKLRMEVKEIDSGKTYELVGGLDNSFWIEKISGSEDLTAHINDKNNPHDTTKAQVGLGNADNTSDLNKPISNATQIALNNKEALLPNGLSTQYIGGDKLLHNFDKNSLGLGNVDNTSDADKPISTVTNIALNGKEDKANKNIPNGYAGLGGDGKILSTLLPAYIDDVVEYPNVASFPLVGSSGIIYVDMSTPFPQKQYRWSGSTYVEIITGAVTSVNGKTGAVTLVKADVGLSNADNTADVSKNVLSATKLTTPRTINGVPFDGSQNIVLPAPSGLDEIFIGEAQPTPNPIKLWIYKKALTDLDILRQIRDTNPTSQLPTLWRDDEDPYTQWEGVGWKELSLYILDVVSVGLGALNNLNNLNKLEILNAYNNSITSLDASDLLLLKVLDIGSNAISNLNINNSVGLKTLYVYNNKLTSIPSLTSKGLIITYDFRYNNFPTTELDRFRGMGFTDESKLLPQNP